MTEATVIFIPLMRGRSKNTSRRKMINRADMLLCRVLCALDRLTGLRRQARNRSGAKGVAGAPT